MNFRTRWIALALLLCAACTERNPEFCGDGTCVDPKLPFCDVDGHFSGIAGTCIAVQCEPASFAYCRGDTAITCNDVGANYDVVKCEMGCDGDASGCIECTTNTQCDAAEVCDAVTNHCRGCVADDECDSLVCDASAGTCVNEMSIRYASPGGSGAACTRADPCSLQQAYVGAANALPLAIVRMLPGTYTSALKADVPTASPVQIVATGTTAAVIGSDAVLVINGGASIDVRNLTSASERQVQCGLASTSAPLSSIILRDSKLTMLGSGIGFELQRCAMDVRNVELATGGPDVLGTRDDTTFRADRFHVRGSAINTLIFSGKRNTIDIVNSLFVDTGIVGFLSDTATPGSSIRFAYSTWLLPNGAPLCGGPASAYVHSTVENSIFTVRQTDDVFPNPEPANCTFVSTMVTKQSVPLPGVVVADPRFVDVGALDFHLVSGSPAINAATVGDVTTDHDLEGAPRPKGAAPDLGAYEME